MSGIPVFSAGTSLQSSGASVSAQIPADSAGMLPLFVRVTATAAGYFKLSQDGASAAVGDLLIQPSDGLILKTCGLSQFSFVSQSGASTVTVTPIDVGGIKYPTNIFTPAALFTTGVSGAWYDPSDFSTMFQDAAGTLPVTAVGQPVGLMLDKSKGLARGPELVTFASLTGTSEWSYGSNVWTLTNSTTNSQTLSVVGLTSSKWYRMVVTVSAINAGSLTFRHPNSSTVIPSSPTISTAGTYTCYFLASGSTVFLRNSTVGQTITVSSVSVRELPGNHATNPSGNSANFPVLQQDGTGRYYLAFNGVNQWLQTNSIDFTYGDKMFVSAGVRKLGDAIPATLAELSTNSSLNAGTFLFKAPQVTITGAYGFWSSGSLLGNALATGGSAAPITNVVSGIGNISGDQAMLRINGSQASSSSGDQGSGNYGNYALYIGASAGTSLWFNGRLYGLVVAGKQASANEIASTEAWLNQKTGAY